MSIIVICQKSFVFLLCSMMNCDFCLLYSFLVIPLYTRERERRGGGERELQTACISSCDSSSSKRDREKSEQARCMFARPRSSSSFRDNMSVSSKIFFTHSLSLSLTSLFYDFRSITGCREKKERV